jgi:hypothetical protein
MFRKMRITRADGTGAMPWSPTVKGVLKRRNVRNKRTIITICIVVLIVMFVCSSCWVLSRGGAAKKVSATAVQTSNILPTPAPGWTPVPGNPFVSFKFEKKP